MPRSGVHRAIDRDLRRELLQAITWVHRDDLGHLRALLHDNEIGFRRKHPDWSMMVWAVEEISALLERLGVVWVLRPHPTTNPARPADSVLRPWVVDSRAGVAS